MDAKKIKLIAMDLDGTLTQHKEALTEEQRAVLDRLAKKYALLMVGAGQVRRIFNQLGQYPIDIIGNYGLQYAVYDKEAKDIRIVEDISLPQGDRDSIEARVNFLRRKHGFEAFKGESVDGADCSISHNTNMFHKSDIPFYGFVKLFRLS